MKFEKTDIKILDFFVLKNFEYNEETGVIKFTPETTEKGEALIKEEMEKDPTLDRDKFFISFVEDSLGKKVEIIYE